MKTIYTVTYNGFINPVIVRYFETRDRAEQWARMAGVFSKAKITKAVQP